MYLRVLDRTMVFQVNEVDGVRTLTPDGISLLDISAEADSRMLTLITERKGNRLLITGKQVSVADVREALKAEDVATIPSNLANILLLGIPVLLVGILLIFIAEQFQRLRYRLPVEGRKARKNEEPETPPTAERNEASK